MRFSLGYPILELDPAPELLTSAAIGAIAAAAERGGFSAISMTEHPAPPQSWRDEHGHDALDPFVGLAAAAAHTTTLSLLTYLTVVPYRNPFLLAKTTATLDRVSDGRLILGVGTGYLRGEFEALGVDFAERNELFDEGLDVMRKAWTGSPVHATGRHFRASGTVAVPVPKRMPPIWIGGNARRTRHRVARTADGWMPIPTRGAQVARRSTAALDGDEQLRVMIDEVLDERARHGPREPLDIMYLIEDVNPWLEPERYVDQVGELERIGVTWIQGGAGGKGVDEIVERIHWFGENIIAKAAGA